MAELSRQRICPRPGLHDARPQARLDPSSQDVGAFRPWRDHHGDAGMRHGESFLDQHLRTYARSVAWRCRSSMPPRRRLNALESTTPPASGLGAGRISTSALTPSSSSTSAATSTNQR